MTKDIYHLVRNVYEDDTVIPLNERIAKNPNKLPSDRLICDTGFIMKRIA